MKGINSHIICVLGILLSLAGCSGVNCGSSPCPIDPKDECIDLAKKIYKYVDVGMSVQEVKAIVGDSLYAESQLTEPYIVGNFVHNGPSINFEDTTPFFDNKIFVVKEFNSGMSACKKMKGQWEE